MNQMIELINEFILKAIVQTENILESDISDNYSLENFTSNRERLLLVIDQISRQIDWEKTPDEIKQDIYKKIEHIKKLDEKLLTKLQVIQSEIKLEIEQTVRQKDNLKGYNLTSVK